MVELSNDGHDMLVTAVQSGGLIEGWNRKHSPNMRVTAGSRIKSVNGKAGNTTTALWALQSETVLHLTFQGPLGQKGCSEEAAVVDHHLVAERVIVEESMDIGDGEMSIEEGTFSVKLLSHGVSSSLSEHGIGSSLSEHAESKSKGKNSRVPVHVARMNDFHLEAVRDGKLESVIHSGRSFFCCTES